MSAAGKSGRKFPPPCWTRDEALVLIEAYRERWHALHRAFLRNPDWDAVAEKVNTSCPDVTPPKTSAQCRHKMEKLRQRHRVEKQRAYAFPGEHFFSSWFYFEAMEAMENGSIAEPGNTHHSQTQNPNGSNPGRGVRIKPSTDRNLLTSAANSTQQSRKPNPNSSYRGSYRYEAVSLVETQIQETMIPAAHRGRESKNHKDGYFVETPIRESKNSSIGGGIRPKPSITCPQEQGRPGLRPRKFSKVVIDEDDDNDEMWFKAPRDTRVKRQNENNSTPNGNSKNLNKEKKKNGGISDVVSSIKLLGDGFLKMEMKKIDMAREIEKMRMESEIKRNELILDSQRQIVDAFVNGVIKFRKETTTMANL